MHVRIGQDVVLRINEIGRLGHGCQSIVVVTTSVFWNVPVHLLMSFIVDEHRLQVRSQLFDGSSSRCHSCPYSGVFGSLLRDTW